jgi:hypothetical protein
MKIKKLLILWLLAILWISSYSFWNFTESWVYYPDWYYRSSWSQLITYITWNKVWTLMDKNIGATEVYDWTPTSYWSISNYNSPCSQLWYFYQFWNYHPFDCSTVLSNFSSIPITDWDWTSVYSRNDNILNSSSLIRASYPSDYLTFMSDAWGWVTNTATSRQNMCPDWFSLPSYNDYRVFVENVVGCTFNYNDDCIIAYDINNGNDWQHYMQELSYFLKAPVLWWYNWYGWSFWFYFQSSNLYLFNGAYAFPPIIWLDQKSSTQFRFGFFSDLIWHSPRFAMSSWGNFPLQPVRCFRNTAVLPDNTWVALTWWDTSLFPDPEPDPNFPGGWWWGGWWWWWGDEIWLAQQPFDPTSYIIRMYASCYWYSWNLPEWFWYSWYYTDCNIDYIWFANTFWWHIQSLSWSSLVIYDSWYDILNFMCNHTSYFNYAFCEELDKYQWSQVWYNIWIFPPKMVVIGSWFAWVSEVWSWWYLYEPNCYGAWCEDVDLGASSLIWNTWDSSWSVDTPIGSRYNLPELSIWEIFSLEYFKNFMSSNLLFACPFIITTWNININLPAKFESYLWDYNPLNPIKCFTKAFKVWKDFSLYKSWVLSFDFWSWEYLFNSDSDLAKNIYSFFDILISLWIVIFFLKIFKFLK